MEAIIDGTFSNPARASTMLKVGVQAGILEPKYRPAPTILDLMNPKKQSNPKPQTAPAAI